MALKVKAKEQLIKVGKYAETYRYVMMPELYTALTQDKVIKEAALRSGVSRGVMQAMMRRLPRRNQRMISSRLWGLEDIVVGVVGGRLDRQEVEHGMEDVVLLEDGREVGLILTEI